MPKTRRLVQQPLPPEPIPRGTATAGLLAPVSVSKYVDHLPLYRQEAILGRLGWDVTRSTLCDQILACAGVLEPLYRLMCDRVRFSAALHTDDTPRRRSGSWPGPTSPPTGDSTPGRWGLAWR